MSVRLSVLAVFLIAFLLVILLNGQNVTIQLFFIKAEAPLYYVIAGSALFGIMISFIFKSFKSYEKRMQKKIEKAKTKSAQENQKTKK